MRCEALTKKKKRCPFFDAAWDERDGKWKCHIHHPQRTYQQALTAKRRRFSAAKAVIPNPALQSASDEELILEFRRRKRSRKIGAKHLLKKGIDKVSDVV